VTLADHHPVQMMLRTSSGRLAAVYRRVMPWFDPAASIF
jgi:hypothetical protein